MIFDIYSGIQCKKCSSETTSRTLNKQPGRWCERCGQQGFRITSQSTDHNLAQLFGIQMDMHEIFGE